MWTLALREEDEDDVRAKLIPPVGAAIDFGASYVSALLLLRALLGRPGVELIHRPA